MRPRNRIDLTLTAENAHALKVTVKHNDQEGMILRLFERGVMVFVECVHMTPEFERSLASDGPALTYDVANALRAKLPWVYAEPVLRNLYILFAATARELPQYPLDIYA